MESLKKINHLTLFVISMAALHACTDPHLQVDPNAVNVLPNDEQTSLRIINANYDATNVNVAVADTTVVSNLGFGASSGYLSVVAGTRAIKGVNGSDTLFDVTADLTTGFAHTAVIFKATPGVEASAIRSHVEPVVAPSGKAQVRFIHASTDLGSVDVKLGTGSATALFAAKDFKSGTDYELLDAGDQQFVLTAAGSTTPIASYNPIALENGKVYTIVALGTIAADSVDFKVRVFSDSGEGKAFVDLTEQSNVPLRAIHASPDAPDVDLLIDGAVVSTALAYPTATAYINTTSGLHTLKANTTGTANSLITEELNLTPGKTYSVFVANLLATIEPIVVEDDLSAPAAGKARIRVAHMVPDGPAANLEILNGVNVFASIGNTTFKSVSNFIEVDAGTFDLQLRDATNDVILLGPVPVTFVDGKIYTYVLYGQVGNTSVGTLTIENN